MLKLNTSMVFREKERKFKNIFELLFRRSVLGSSYKRTTIDKFENGTLKVFFRLYLDRRKIPRSITNVEDTIQDIIVKEAYSISSLFKDMELDLTSVSVKKISQEGSASSKQGQQKHTMITKNGLLRPNRNGSLITSSKPKTKPVKLDAGEPDIDFNNIPTIQGTYRATKVNITAENSTKGTTTESITDVQATTKGRPLTSATRESEEESSEAPATSTSRTTPSTTTAWSPDQDVFKDVFHKPDLETSPWKPIVPTHVNTEFKLLPDDNNSTESSTRHAISPASSDGSAQTGSGASPSAMPGLPLESLKFRDVPGMSTFDSDDADFPRDRVVPSSTVSRLDDDLEIEVAGQLPPETYSVRLRASSKREDSDAASSETSTRQTFGNASSQGKREEPSATRQPESATPTMSTMTNGFSDETASKSPDTSGIGVAEPVLDAEIELEAKNRYSEVPASKADEEDALRNRKVDVEPQRPVYTSYNTPDLNGGSLSSSLIRNSATMKPFRHTIPVDKITSVVNYSSDFPVRDAFLPEVPLDADESPRDKNASSLANLERVVQVETFVKAQHDDETMVQLPHYGRVTSTDSSDDELAARPSSTEVYSEPSPSAKDGVLEKKSVSRNSTFVEIDTVKHTPSESEESWEPYGSEVAPAAAGDEGDLRKKVYNDTLKAYVVENLVTLAPVKSNTGVGRPVRPRPKIESLTEDSSLLEQLFGVRDYSRERHAVNGSSEDSSTSSLETTTQPDRLRFNEEETSTGKNTVIEQIVEVVTSISTKVSSSIKGDPVVLKLIVGNSTALPLIRSEKTSTSDKEEDRSFGTVADTTEKVSSTLSQQRPLPLSSANLRTMQTSDRKISALEEENRILLEKLKQLAEIRTDGDSVQVARNGSSNDATMSGPLQGPDAPSPNIDELKKIADVAVGNETLKNASSGVTLSRDGVEVFTKVLNKLEDRANKTTSMTRTIANAAPDDNCAGFLCRDGKCLDSSAMCNMLVECSNSEDEANCTCADFLRTQLLYRKICDGIVDCWDYSDESDCDYCRKGQFVCGNTKSCVDSDKVCDGFSDCAGGEDEKKCTALIDDEPEGDMEVIVSTRNTSTDYSVESGRTAKEPHFDQEAVESSIVGTTTLYDLPGDVRAEKLTDENGDLSKSESTDQRATLGNRDEDEENGKITVAVSSREISSNLLRNGLTPGSGLRAESNRTFSIATATVPRGEVDSYNDNGYLSIRKNGKWGKLCLSDTDSILRERQAAWSIEDLAKAACKAITYQDYEMAEKVLDQNPPPNSFYYSLSHNDKSSDRTALSFKSSECPGREILKVKCKNFECGIRSQVTSTASAQNDYWVARIGATRRESFRSPYEQLLRLDYISLHPDYVDNGFVNDIAVLRLERPVTFSDYIRPVCLPANPVSTGTVCIITGWGQLFEINRVFPDTLQEVELPVISTEDCRRKTLFLPLYRITSGMLCAGLRNGEKDACLGDSGGPLVCLSENRYILQGITSNGYGCGRRERPGVYTKIFHFLDYIDSVVTQKDIQLSAVAFCKGHRCPLGECLPKSRVCNGFLECSDGSDERDCPATL
ncbi:Enteropeptidase [Harpegnathos saltator]|uniref:Enteropeptidase n=1 Tax=Harpegnathos saltator TaxID=610380 RepID=E2BWC8_HARSA|nr:Enteropeptidase [Harpegnathos saltator]